MKIITALPLFTSCTLAVILACNALFCNPCEQTQCPDVQDCPVGTVMEPCGCCEVCAIPEGESCNTMEFGLCADEKFCLPDGGLSSGAITGKCLGITECFSSGCDAFGDFCECGYSNSCPTKIFEFGDQVACEESLADNTTEELFIPEECISYGCEIVDSDCICIYSDICPVYIFTFPTKEDCEAVVNATTPSCDNVACAQALQCPVGAYYVPGPQLPGECCPSDGLCLCDEDLCPEDLECPAGYDLVNQSTANDTEDQCCDTYTCEKLDLNCELGDQIVQNEAIFSPDPCTHCKCSNGELYCAVASCIHVECGPTQQLVVQAGDCCPSCQPLLIIDPPPVPVCEIEGEFIDPENPCRICTCYNGRTSCLEHACEPVVCQSPVIMPGACCPVCEQPTALPPTEETTVIATPPATTTLEPTSEVTTVQPSEVSTTIDEPSTVSQHTTVPPTETSTTTEIPTETSTTIEIPTIPAEGIVTTPVPTEEIVFPLPTLSITRPSSPYVPRLCSRQDRPNQRQGDACLTCMCIDGVERCIDQTKTLCGVPRCGNPVMIQGECCPVCIDNEVHLPSDDKSRFVVSMVIDTELFEYHENNAVLEKLIEDELEIMSYSLADMRDVSFGKTQVELVVVVEQVKFSDVPQDQVATALLERLSSVHTTPAASRDNSFLRAHVSDNVVIVVCVISFLMAVILMTVFGIFLVCVWITKINKKQRKNSTNSEKYDQPEKV